jgi:hypothetical protein
VEGRGVERGRDEVYIGSVKEVLEISHPLEK